MKQRKKHEEEQENIREDKVNQAEATATLTEKEEETLRDSKTAEELAALQVKFEEVNDKYLRLYSEFDNFRKRVLKEKIELSKTASEQVLTDFLGILDDFERAIASFEHVETVEPVKEGTLLIYNKFRNNLVQKGLAEIEAMGQDFNTDFHEAIANVPAASPDQKNKVIDVTQKGYTLNGKVIRYAKVVVAK
ncbi:MAG TPA: nucleotide exchange factor GrpE [Lentimicrobium sp.]|nr:nucleotide exchange factor GrpE [Lentimicrobium sp.]